jgi:Glycosyltransferase family 87
VPSRSLTEGRRLNELLRTWVRRLIPGLLAAALALAAWGNLAFVARAPTQSPFVPRWIGLNAWLRQGGSPYDASVSLEAQTGMYGRLGNLSRGEDPQHFLYPPAVALVLGPFVFLPLSTARAIWMTLLQVGLLTVILVAGPAFRWTMTGAIRVGVSILTLLSLPSVLAVLQGDVAIVVVALILISLGALHRRHDTLAGLLAASTIVKPQLALLYILYLYVWGIRNQRWNLLGWLTTGLVMVLGVTTALLPSWPLEVARQSLDYAGLDVFRSVVSRALGLGGEPYSAWVLIASALVLGYLFWEWRVSLAGGERSMLWAVMVTLALTVGLTPFATLANQVMLIPPLLFAAGVLHDRIGQGRSVQLAFLLSAVSLLSWLASAKGLDPGGPSSAALVVPPLVVLLILWWVRWWATRPSLVLEAASFRSRE